MKAALFYVLMFLRPMLKLALRALGALFFFGFVMILIMSQYEEAKISIFVSFIFFIFSFVTFLAGWFYDNLLFKLNPESNTLILDR